MKDLISVIVPIYNSELYLQECIRSVLEQSYTCFELILIDDGSQDNSKDICQKVCEADDRIRFFSQKHSGTAAARNAGIKEAIGKYLFFLDSDDVIHSELLEILYGVLKERHSSIAAEQYLYIEDGHLYEQLSQNKKAGNACRYTFLKYDIAMKCFTSGEPPVIASVLYGIGGKMICRDTLGDIVFDTSLPNGEDTKFMYQILAQGTEVVILHQSWYYYRQHKNNISRCSVKSCESMRRCQKYMIAQEYKSGRINGAVSLEKYLLSRMVDWYVESKKMDIKELSGFLKVMAEKERKLKIFSKVEFRERLKFMLAFDSFPMYWFIHIIFECKK